MSRVTAKPGNPVYTVELSQDEAQLLADILFYGVEFSNTKLGKFAETLWGRLVDAGARDEDSGVILAIKGEYLVQEAE